MKVELPIWAKTDSRFIDCTDNKSTSRHAISAHFYFGIHVRIVPRKSPKRLEFPTGAVVYDDKTISLHLSDESVDFSDGDVDPLFDKLFERDTGRDLGCSLKLSWNFLPPIAIISSDALFSIIFVQLSEIGCLSGMHANQHERG